MKLSTQILLAFSIVLILSIADSLTNYRLSLKVEQNTRFLSQSEAVIRNSNRIHKTIIEMQSAFRGYLLTTDTNFLHSYYAGLKTVPTLMEEQKKIIRDNKLQLSTLDSIRALHTEWIDYAGALIDSKKGMPGRLPDTYNILFDNKLKKQVGKKLNDEILDNSFSLIKPNTGSEIFMEPH